MHYTWGMNFFMNSGVRLGVVAVAGILVGGRALGQDLTVKAAAETGPIALLGGTVHPVSGPVIESGLVLFDKGVITAVGRGDTVRLSSDVRIVDCTGRHVYPGMIAAQTRLGLTEIESVRPTLDFDEAGDMTPEVRACVSVNPDSTLIPVARTNGVLTALTLPAGGLVPGRASVMRLDGWTWEDMTVLGDAGLVVNWPRVYRPANRWTGKAADRDVEGIETLTKMVSAARAYFARAADERTTDLRLASLGPYVEAGEGQKALIVSADSVDQITSAVQWADENGLKLRILGGRDAPLCASILIEHAVPVIVRGTHGFPSRADAPFDDAFTLPGRLASAGVAWCLAPSDIDANVRNLPYEAATAVAYGLDEDLAVRSITLSAAEVLGIADRLGSLEPGKAATVIVTDGPLLEVRSNTTMAFVDGREIDLSNKQTQLRDKYREKYRQLGIIGDE